MKKTMIMIVLVSAISGLASADAASENQMVYYNMSNGFTDLSGNNRDGIGQGGVTSGSATGVFGGATSFDGSDDYVEVPDLPSSEIENMSISVWYNLDTITVNNIGGSIYSSGYDSSANNDDYQLGFTETDVQSEVDSVIWKRYDGQQNGIFREPYSFNTGTWRHLVAQYDNSKEEWQLYRNGNLINTNSSATGPGGVNTVSDAIGASFDEGDGVFERLFPGDIDELRVYNQTLSENQINSLYENNSLSTTDSDGSDQGTGNNLYKKVNITDQSGSSIPSMQVELNVSYDSDMQSDFSDLRFYESTDKQTELDYYLVDKQDSSWARVFVDVSDIPASGTKSVYMFYGNSSLSSASDGSSTFPFFDGAEDGSMSEYSQGSLGGSSTSWSAIQSNLFKGDYVFEDEGVDDNEAFWTEVDSIQNQDLLFGGFTEQRADTNTRLVIGNTSASLASEPSNDEIAPWSNDAGFVSMMFHETNSLYFCASDEGISYNTGGHTYQYMINLDQQTFDFDLDNDRVVQSKNFCQDTDNDLNNGVRPVISSLYTGVSTIDDIYLAEYRMPEPTVSFSSEESVSSFSLNVENPSEGESLSSSDVELNGSVSTEANITYSLDSESNQNICSNCTSFSTTLTDLSEGSHQAEVTATKYDNSSVSETVLINFTINLPPRYRNVNQEFDSIIPSVSNNLSAEGYDATGLSQAFLVSNQTGVWTKYNSVNNFKKNSGNEWFASNGESQPAHDNIQPQGEYVSEENRTYVTWQGADLDPYIKYYDHDTRSWSQQYQVGSNPYTNDDHGAPSMVIDDTGYIHVFFGSHNTEQQYYRSSNAYEISSWNDKSSALGASSATYPIPGTCNGELYLGYRNTVNDDSKPIVLKTSSDGGDTWSSVNNLADFSDGTSYWNYPGTFDCRNGNIHFSWAEDINDQSIENARDRRSQYYAIYNMSDENVYSISGTNYGSTISESEARNSDVEVYIPDARDASGNPTTIPRFAWNEKRDQPYFIFTESFDWTEGSSSSSFMHRWTTWNGDGWTSPENITRAENDNCCTIGTIIPNNGSVEAYLPEDFGSGTARGGNITKWKFNGSGFEKTELIASTEDYRSMNAPSKITNFRESFKIMFSEVDIADYSNSDLKVFGWGEKNIFGSPESFGSVSDSWKLADFIYDDAGYADWTVGWKIQFEDSSGNTNTTGLNTFTVGDYQTADTTPPTSSDNWTDSDFVDKSSAEIELTASDSDGSVSNITYSINGGSEQAIQGSSGTITVSQNGNNTVEYFAVDDSGNVENSNTINVALADVQETVFGIQQNTSKSSDTDTQYLFKNKELSNPISQVVNGLSFSTPSVPGNCQNCGSKQVDFQADESKNITARTQGDWIAGEQAYGLDKASSAVEYGAFQSNYSTDQLIEARNDNADLDLSVKLDPVIPSDTECSVSSSTEVSIASGVTENNSITKNCDPGDEQDYSLTKSISDNVSSYEYNGTVEVYSDRTDEVEHEYWAKKSRFTDFSNRNTSSVNYSIDGLTQGLDVSVKSRDGSDYLVWTAYTNRTNSSIHQGTHYFNYEYSVESSDSDDGGSTGGTGGTGGSSGGDQTQVTESPYDWDVTLVDSEFVGIFKPSVRPGSSFEKEIVVNSRESDLEIDVGCESDEDACSWVSSDITNINFEDSGQTVVTVRGQVPEDAKKNTYRFNIAFTDPAYEEGSSVGKNTVRFVVSTESRWDFVFEYWNSLTGFYNGVPIAFFGFFMSMLFFVPAWGLGKLQDYPRVIPTVAVLIFLITVGVI